MFTIRTCDTCGETRPRKYFMAGRYAKKKCSRCRSRERANQLVTIKCDFCGSEAQRKRNYIRSAKRSGRGPACGQCAASGHGRGARTIDRFFASGQEPWDFVSTSSIEYQRCGKCDEIKPLDSYTPSKTNNVVGRQSYCRDCRGVTLICDKCGDTKQVRHQRARKSGLCKDCFQADTRSGSVAERIRKLMAREIPLGRMIEYKWYRWSVFKRDKFTCRGCESDSKPLELHHIRPKSFFLDMALDSENGISLCNSCHRKETRAGRAALKAAGQDPLGVDWKFPLV